ncbi:MAG: RNA-directed DNA polymerase [Paludibacteraceae bacterium]|nr:RNA-directed DNA polymerase [Paludibacteraceae bacterium]
MYYITTMQHRKPRQLSWEDVIMDKLVMNDYVNDKSNSTATITRKYENIPDEVIKKINVELMVRWLHNFNEESKELFERKRESLYSTFRIPKQSGGFRRIDAPCEELQNQLRKLVTFISDDCGVLYHTSAFAYIKGRSIVDCVRKHQKNESNWFLKTDFSGFFPNTTLDFTMKMLSMIFPLSEICKRKDGYSELEKAISLGFLNGGLPQGTVLSPMLTNMFMIPIDHKLFNELAGRKLVYTRYADDIHISGQEHFPFKEIVTLIENTLAEFNAPWVIKKEKTHYGSRKGKNWNLGLMLNKDNDITIGWKKKQYFKAALCSFILDTKNKKYWDLGDVQHLRGQLSYYMMVEKEYFEKIIIQQNKKWNVNVKEMFKEYLNGTFA